MNRNILSTSVNFISLIIAFTAVIIVGMHIRYQFMYDRNFDNNSSIYSLVLENKNWDNIGNDINRELPELISKLPEVESVAIYSMAQLYMSNITENGQNMDAVDLFTCDKNFFDMFSIEIINGKCAIFDNPNNVIISSDIAEKWFGDKNPVGAELIDEEGDRYTISAVFQSIPENSSIKCDILASVGQGGTENPQQYMYNAYIQLHDNIDQEKFEVKVNSLLEGLKKEVNYYKGITVMIIPLADLQYVISDNSSSYLNILLFVVLAILIVVFINFFCFSTINIIPQIKAITIKKIFGATKTELRIRVVLKYLYIILRAFICAVLLVELIKVSLGEYFIVDISFIINIYVYITVFILSMILGVMTSLYSMIYSTSYNPASMLNGVFFANPAWKVFQVVMLYIQFIIAISLICISIFVSKQYDLLVDKDLGYDASEVLVCDFNGSYYNFSKYEELKAELLNLSQITDVTYSGHNFAEGSYSRMSSVGTTIDNTNVRVRQIDVARNFLSFFNIPIIKGVGFENKLANAPYHIINEKFAKDINVDLGDTLPLLNGQKGEVVGVFDNICLTTFKEGVEPASLVYSRLPVNAYSKLYIKISEPNADLISAIRKVTQSVDDKLTYNIIELEQKININYKTELNTKLVIQSFAFLSALISIMGIFVVILMEIENKRKEIFIRKINGAKANDIIGLFARKYILIALSSCILSAIIVYSVVNSWLMKYPTRIDISIWVFIGITLAVMIAIYTVIHLLTYKIATKDTLSSGIK